MPLEIQGPNISSLHYGLFKTADKFQEKDLYYFSASGIARIGEISGENESGFIGNSGSSWREEKLLIHVPFDLRLAEKIMESISDIPTGDINAPTFACKHWRVFASPNKVYNKSYAIDSGHAVNAFRLTNPRNIISFAIIEVDIGVRDRDAYLYRVGFQLDMLLYYKGY